MMIHFPPHRQKNRFEATLTTAQFMEWDEGECRVIKVNRITKNRGRAGYSTTTTTYSIPAPYHRLVSQFMCEEEHAQAHNSHESYRRQAYALRVLDAFAEELHRLDTAPTASFRSKVLTPILQRQLMGVHDAYAPSVRRAIANGDGKPTITDATGCYLSQDPVSPEYIPYYRHHLLYLPEARWHLAVIMEPGRCGNAEFYNMIRINHNRIMQQISVGEEDEENPEAPPLLTAEEVEVIFEEGLADFFQPELARVVSLASLFALMPTNFTCICSLQPKMRSRASLQALKPHPALREPRPAPREPRLAPREPCPSLREPRPAPREPHPVLTRSHPVPTPPQAPGHEAEQREKGKESPPERNEVLGPFPGPVSLAAPAPRRNCERCI